jgi:hypothetical protein
MKISIVYDSIWQTRFLGDDKKKPIKINSNTNKPSDKGFMQKFVATSKSKAEKPSPITKSTVLGVLCRLIGDQRKLYQAKQSSFYYFREIEDKITFETKPILTSNELSYLKNKSDDRCAPSQFLGVIPDNNPWFFSKESSKFWSVLFLDKHSLVKYILSDKPLLIEVDCNPKILFARLESLSNTKGPYGSILQTKKHILINLSKEIEKQTSALNKKLEYGKIKPPKEGVARRKYDESVAVMIENLKILKNRYKEFDSDTTINEWDKKIDKLVNKLEKIFPKQEYISNYSILPLRLYAVALYLQADRLIKNGHNLDYMKNKKGEIQIQGFSKRGFNGIRDWFNPMTGKRKKSVGTPCNIQKQSGALEIIIDISKDEAKRLRDMIKDAGVSSFYLGKKGLAYVEDIKVAEVKK